MAITTLDGLVSALPGQQLFYAKMHTSAVNSWTALSHTPGLPGQPANPSSGLNGEILTDASSGMLPFVNPSDGNSYLGKISGASGAVGAMMLYDRLWQNLFISNVTSLQSIAAPALTRYTTGDGVELWVQFYSVGSSAPTFTVNYTNQAGQTGRVTTFVPTNASNAAGRTVPVPLTSGDIGVRSVQSVQLSAAITATPILGFVLRKRLATIPIGSAGSGATYGPFDAGMPIIPNDTAFEFLHYAQLATTNNTYTADIQIVQG